MNATSTDNELERTKTQLARMTKERDLLASALARVRALIELTSDTIARGV